MKHATQKHLKSALHAIDEWRYVLVDGNDDIDAGDESITPEVVGDMLDCIQIAVQAAIRTENEKGESGMPQGYSFEWDICPECGQPVKRNWLVRHLNSGCKLG